MDQFKNTAYFRNVMRFETFQLRYLLQYSPVYAEDYYNVSIEEFDSFAFAECYLLSNTRKLVDEGAPRIGYMLASEMFQYYLEREYNEDISKFIKPGVYVPSPTIFSWIGFILPIMHIEYQLYIHEILEQHSLREFVEWFETGHLLDPYDYCERMKVRFQIQA